MTKEEAIEILKCMLPKPIRADGKSTSHLMQTQALLKGIEALENQKSVIEELEDLFEKMRRRNNQQGHDDYWYFSSGINLTILDKRICELKGEAWKPYIERKIEAELKGENK